MGTRGIPIHRPPRKEPPAPRPDWTDTVDWTGTRMRSSGQVGELTLTASVAEPYSRGDEGVTDFVIRYARAAIERMGLRTVLIRGPNGAPLGEVLPEVKKAPF